MAQDPRSGLFVGALISSVAGFALLIVTDFGGWYNYYYQGAYDYPIHEYNYIGISSPVTVLGLLILGLPFVYCMMTSLKGLQNPNSISRERVSFAFTLSVFQIAIVFGGALVFAILVSGSDDWWFGAGFYGSAIGGILTVVFLAMARKSYANNLFVPSQYLQMGTLGFPQGPQQSYQPYGPQIPPQQMSSIPVQPVPQSYGQFQAQPPAAPTQLPQSPLASRFCTGCGAAVVEGCRFCQQCGSPIP